MIEYWEKRLNCKEQLRRNKQILIDAFVEYYGEDKRQEIEEKFNKALLIAYRAPETTKVILEKIGKIHSDEIISSLMKEIPSNWTKEDLFSTYNIENQILFPIKKFKDFYDKYKLGEEGRKLAYKEDAIETIQQVIPNFTQEDYAEIATTRIIPQKYESLSLYVKNNILYLTDVSNAEKDYKRLFDMGKELLQKIDPNVSLDNIQQIIEHDDVKALIKYAESLPQILAEYETRMKKYEPYQKEAKEIEQIKRDLDYKYYLKNIEENIDLLPEQEQKEFEMLKNNPSKKYMLPEYLRFIFGYGLNGTSPLEAFSEESEKILNNPNKPNWKKDSIKKDRVNFFKKNGIDLGDKYELYLENEAAKKIWPSFDRVAKFIKTKQQYLKEFRKELYTNQKKHKETREEIDTYHLLDKDDNFDETLYYNETAFDGNKTFVSPNVRITPNGYDSLSLVIICCNPQVTSIDHDIIHELNHLFELSLIKVDDKSHEEIFGWDYSTSQLNQTSSSEKNESDDEKKRQYELFNEIINELIAQEIYEKMLAKGKYIFDTKETAKVRGKTSYEYTLFLVKDFFYEFKEEILESRRNNNINIILDKVGKENFNELNSLFKIFYENFKGMEFYRLVKSLNNKEDTEKTRIYYNLIERRNIILERMKNHSEKKELTSQEEKKSGRKL